MIILEINNRLRAVKRFAQGHMVAMAQKLTARLLSACPGLSPLSPQPPRPVTASAHDSCTSRAPPLLQKV